MTAGSPSRVRVGAVFRLHAVMSTPSRLLAAGASVVRRPIQTTPTIPMAARVPHVPRRRYRGHRTICAPDALHVLAVAVG